MSWILIIFLGTVIFCCVYYLTRNYNYWKERDFPHVKTLPIIDTIVNLLLIKEPLLNRITDIYNKFDGNKFGGFILCHKPALMILDPDLISQILITDFACFQNRGVPVAEWEPLGCNIVSLSGDAWRVLRHKLTPTFSSVKVKSMFDQIKECSNILITYIKSKNDEPLEVKYLTEKFNINVIASVVLGLCPHKCDQGKKNILFDICCKFFKPSISLIMKYFIRLCFPKISRILKIQMIDDESTDFFIHLIHDIIEHREKTGEKRNDFLQSMMDIKSAESSHHYNLSEANNISNNYFNNEQIKNNFTSNHNEDEVKKYLEQLDHDPGKMADKFVFTDSVIAAQVFTFITMGSEAISNTISFTLYELANNPGVQSRLQKEIDTVLLTQEITYNNLKKMTYMDQVINEVLRIHPALGVISRECAKDYIIPGTNKVIEEGVLIMIPVISIHRDPKYFPEPEKFDPDRFQDMNAIPRGIFFPFGSGPRVCIAIRLAMLEIKVFLAFLLSECNVRLSSKLKLPLKLESNSMGNNVAGGLWLQFESRKKTD
ncbi:cytochrome P450 6a2-like [Lycorma delicatula]|uniref:cytochrome P450 6a2-like n=1 Tax=Lycorma delicatula TaxID=130591 RepID=UPI003F51889D